MFSGDFLEFFRTGILKFLGDFLSNLFRSLKHSYFLDVSAFPVFHFKSLNIQNILTKAELKGTLRQI